MTAQAVVNGTADETAKEHVEDEKIKLQVEPAEEALPEETPVEPPLYIKIKEVSFSLNM